MYAHENKKKIHGITQNGVPKISSSRQLNGVWLRIDIQLRWKMFCIAFDVVQCVRRIDFPYMCFIFTHRHHQRPNWRRQAVVHVEFMLTHILIYVNSFVFRCSQRKAIESEKCKINMVSPGWVSQKGHHCSSHANGFWARCGARIGSRELRSKVVLVRASFSD